MQSTLAAPAAATARALEGKITSRTARVGVIGLGYVGLPLAVYVLYRLRLPYLGEMLPPGIVYSVGAMPRLGPWLLLPALGLLVATRLIAGQALRHCTSGIARARRPAGDLAAPIADLG